MSAEIKRIFLKDKKTRIALIRITPVGCFVAVNISVNSDGYVRDHSHRKIFSALNRGIPHGMIVRHSCDNRKCLNPDHLLLGSHQDNVGDRVKRKRSAFGTRNGRAKLTPEDVLHIRRAWKRTITRLAKDFKVSRRLIKMIKDEKIWKNLAPNRPPVGPKPKTSILKIV